MTLTFNAVDGIGEVSPGDDIPSLIVDHATLEPGDVVVITSKIVSKAAGLATTRSKEELFDTETDRLVARRGQTSIVRTHHGLTMAMAMAGIDNSNTAPGTLIALPPDADASAAQIRDRLLALTGTQVAVIISDTAGRAWRTGQTDIAIGCAGIVPFESLEERTDPYGNQMAVTAPAIADQIAGAAELASGKFGARPVVIMTGANPSWLTDGDGPGARALIRDEDSDMFGLGAREAAIAAILGDQVVRGLPRAHDVSVDDIVEIAVNGVRGPGQQIHIDGDEVIITTEADARAESGIIAQRITSLGLAHGHHVRVHIR